MALTHLTADELAARWKMSPGTLQNHRTQGKGPSFVKIGKRVLYRLDVIEQYEQERTMRNTGEAA